MFNLRVDLIFPISHRESIEFVLDFFKAYLNQSGQVDHRRLLLTIHILGPKEKFEDSGFFFPVFRRSNKFAVFGFRRRKVIYSDNTDVRVKFSKTKCKVEIKPGNLQNLSNHILDIVLWWTGEMLERQGYVRVHAAGFVRNGLTQCIFAQSGTGKSLLSFLLAQADQAVLGDELLFIKNLQVIPMVIPLRLSEADFLKWSSVKIEPQKNQLHLRSNSTQNKFSISGLTRDPLEQPLFGSLVYLQKEASPYPKIKFLMELTLGLGLPQMGQYLIRMDSFLSLIGVAIQRFSFGVNLLRKDKLNVLVRKDNPISTVQELLNPPRN